jgi:O-antigen ligase
VKPFDGLAVRNGVQYLQAHNAWLDVWLQLGIVGLVVFILLVLTTLRRAWFLAVDRPRDGVADDKPYTALTLFPLLVLAAFVAQSAAESRLILEAGFTLLVVISVKTKQAAP